MIGGAGSDLVTYSFNPNAIQADLSAGTINGGSTDTVLGVEDMIGTPFDDKLKGSEADNNIFGLQGDDFIDGRGGDDRLLGNEDDDEISGRRGDDTLIGGAGRDSLFGEADDDSLLGEKAPDDLSGGDGRDSLDGGDGRDSLQGGEEQDVLTGGKEHDVFVFESPAEAGVGSSADRITDFVKHLDKIDLVVIDADAATLSNEKFVFVKTDFFSSKAGELRFFTAAGETVIQGDTDGDGLTNFDIVLTGIFILGAGDFVL